jgi:hypothetical protein
MVGLHPLLNIDAIFTYLGVLVGTIRRRMTVANVFLMNLAISDLVSFPYFTLPKLFFPASLHHCPSNYTNFGLHKKMDIRVGTLQAGSPLPGNFRWIFRKSFNYIKEKIKIMKKKIICSQAASIRRPPVY